MAVTTLRTSSLRSGQEKYSSVAATFRTAPHTVTYLVVAGGGGVASSDAAWIGGSGGAGGYRCSVTGENSGGLSPAEAPALVANTSYAVTVGAGGLGSAINRNGAFDGGKGSNSVFGPVVSEGGGGGGFGWSGPNANNGYAGGSGGGGGADSSGSVGGAGIAGQGFAGGNSPADTSGDPGGGGGAGGAGGRNTGGAGLASSITGSSVTRAVGGNATSTANGAANTGNGASSRQVSVGNTNGGSGVVIIRLPNQVVATFSAGVTQTKTLVGNDAIYTITAAGPTDTVTFG